jgi:hypothetical protein
MKDEISPEIRASACGVNRGFDEPRSGYSYESSNSYSYQASNR